MCLLSCMIIIYIHEKWLPLNLNERVVHPFYVCWENLFPFFSSSHKRNIKKAVLPFIESVFKCHKIAPCLLLFLLLYFFSLSVISFFIFSFLPNLRQSST